MRHHRHVASSVVAGSFIRVAQIVIAMRAQVKPVPSSVVSRAAHDQRGTEKVLLAAVAAMPDVDAVDVVAVSEVDLSPFARSIVSAAAAASVLI